MSEKIKNTAIFTTTIVEPTGVPARIEISIPEAEHSTEIKAEHIVTALKFLNTKKFSAPVGRGHNNCLNRRRLDRLSALKLCYVIL